MKIDLIFRTGFGPNGNRDRQTNRLKDVYGHGYTPNSDSHSNGPINSHSGSITDQGSGTHFSNGRGPSSSNKLGSDSFLNRPVTPNGHQNGKTARPTNENTRPSILATRRPIYNGSGPDKFVDGTNGDGSHTHTNSHGTHSSTSDGGSSNGHQHHRHHGHGQHSTNNGNANTGSPDNLSHNKNQPIRNGGYDTSGNGHGGHGHPDNNGPSTNTGLQPYENTRNRVPPKETSDTFDRTHERPPTDVAGNGDQSTGTQTTDVLSGFRNVFKLPPGLCLAKCDTLRPDQTLTSDQIRDAFIASGFNGKPCDKFSIFYLINFIATI